MTGKLTALFDKKIFVAVFISEACHCMVKDNLFKVFAKQIENPILLLPHVFFIPSIGFGISGIPSIGQLILTIYAFAIIMNASSFILPYKHPLIWRTIILD